MQRQDDKNPLWESNIEFEFGTISIQVLGLVKVLEFHPMHLLQTVEFVME